ncbi:MAG: UbiA family prenyltransferase [Candidatus Thermoplasmatota archaeon]|nr:UbiA family prenyltransferase [Candidatus Thermoplasmatota archaeon]
MQLKSKQQPKKLSVRNKLFAHLETWRPYTIVWCGLVSLAGACLSYGKTPSLTIMLLSFFIPLIGWIASLYASDYLDKELDFISKKNRPIPSGRITPNEAVISGTFFAIFGFLLSFLLSIYNVILTGIVALLVISYTKIFKSKGILGNINRGFITIAAYFFGILSVQQNLSNIPIHLYLLAFVFLLHDTNSNMIGAIRDIKGDRKGGYQTFPVKFGIKKSMILSFILTSSWFILLLIIAVQYHFLSSLFYLVLLLDVIILFIFYHYLIKTFENHSKKIALRYHEFFIIERITLASALLFGVIDFFIALSIFLLTMTLTLISQYLLRGRYEGI